MEHPENRGTCTLLIQLLSRRVSKPFGTNFFLCIKPIHPSCRRYSSQRCSVNSLSVIGKYYVTIKSPDGTGTCVRVFIPWDKETRCSFCNFYAPKYWRSYQERTNVSGQTSSQCTLTNVTKEYHCQLWAHVRKLQIVDANFTFPSHPTLSSTMMVAKLIKAGWVDKRSRCTAEPIQLWGGLFYQILRNPVTREVCVIETWEWNNP